MLTSSSLSPSIFACNLALFSSDLAFWALRTPRIITKMKRRQIPPNTRVPTIIFEDFLQIKLIR